MRPKSRYLFRQGITLRGELAAFVVLFTLWAFSLNVFASAFFALLQKFLSAWVAKHLALAVLAGTAVFLLLTYLGFLFLAWELARKIEEARHIAIVVPIMAFTDRLELVSVEGYRFSESLRIQADRITLLKSYRESVQQNPGRPIQGILYREIAASVVNTLLSGLIKECDYLLSEDSRFHGANYFELAHPPGPCKRSAIQGVSDRQICLPDRCQAELRWCPPNTFGKSTQEIVINGDYGTISISIGPEWPILGDYHQKSLELAKSRLRTDVKNYSDRDPSRPPVLWVLELPVHLQVQFRNVTRPWIFLFRRFEIFASWAEELLERMENRVSWERFVDKLQETEGLLQQLNKPQGST